MDLAQLRFAGFVEAVVKVTQLLIEEESGQALLDAARVDTPIVDEFLRELELTRLRGGEHGEATTQALNRDLTVVLAMRHLNEKSRNQQPHASSLRYLSN